MELGVCYYPEQWPRQRWQVDAAMMAEAGLRYVRIGEFAWAGYEPEQGRFDWEWLDVAVETLHAAGLQVILGTPTATPPIWLAVARPEILSVGADGRRRPYGSRRHTCPTSLAYRKESTRIVAALVDRYGTHPAVTGWQIDNEPGNHDSARCWCDPCEAAFGAWLQRRYGTIDELNSAWGTIFWSQVYPDFASVRLPRPAPTAHSPSLRLAHLRFASHQVIRALEEQAAIIRAGSPGRDLTVNFYAGDTFVDYREAARIGGIGAIDSYPHGAASPAEVRFWHDLARGISGCNRGWIMEQQPGPINWTATNPPVADGQVTAWLEDAAADGIERTLLFRWRAALAGQEQYHSGLLRHDASPDRALDEVTEIASKLLSHPKPEPSRIAVVFDYEDAWTFQIEPHHDGLTHRELVVAAHQAARDQGPVDIVGWEDDWSHYPTVLIPAAILASPQRAATVRSALAAGSTVVVGPRSLTRDSNSTARPTPVPLYLEEAATVVEGLSLPAGGVIAETNTDIGAWFDVLDDSRGRTIGSIVEPSHLAGLPMAVANAHQDGVLVQMGASSRDAWTWLLGQLSQRPAAPNQTIP